MKHLIVQTLRGFTNLPHVGPHPGLLMGMILIVLGGVAGGQSGTLTGMAMGLGLSGLLYGGMMATGAYGRAQHSDRLAGKAKPKKS